MEIGFVISSPDNDSYRFLPESAVGRCEGCGFIPDRTFVDPAFHLSRRNADLSQTYDGGVVASQLLRDVLIRHSTPDVEFRRLPKDESFWLLEARRTVAFDPIRRGTRFEKACGMCGVFESVVGAIPAFLKTEEPLGFGLFRTDLEFGSGNEKSPLLIVSAELRNILMRERIKGVSYEAVRGQPN